MALSNRELLVRAILAFDLMLKDCIEHEAKDEDFHETAFMVLKFLANLLKSPPEHDHLRSQYYLNVSEISARIKLIFCNSTISEEELESMLETQMDRLKWLGKECVKEGLEKEEAGQFIQ